MGSGGPASHSSFLTRPDFLIRASDEVLEMQHFPKGENGQRQGTEREGTFLLVVQFQNLALFLPLLLSLLRLLTLNYTSIGITLKMIKYPTIITFKSTKSNWLFCILLCILLCASCKFERGSHSAS